MYKDYYHCNIELMCNHKIVTLNYHIITVLCNETIVTMGYCVFTTYGHLILFYQTVVKLKWIVIAMMPWSTEHIDTGYLWNICRLLPCTDIVQSGYRDVLWFNTYSLKINSWGLHLFKKIFPCQHFHTTHLGERTRT